MYILQNAGKNILRNKGRNILMGVIILAIIATSAVALIINNTSNAIIDDYRERFASEVRIVPDLERVRDEAMRAMQEGGGIGGMMRGGGAAMRNLMAVPQIMPEQYIAFSHSQYIRETIFTASVSVHNSDDISPIDEELGGSGEMMRVAGGMGMRMIRGDGSVAEEVELYESEIAQMPSFYANLMGFTHLPEEFTNGTRRLASGYFPSDIGEAILSRDLLENSELSIGDVITLTTTLVAAADPDYDDNTELVTYDITYTLTIVGYFDDITPEYAIPFMQNAFLNRRNEIITTADTVLGGMREGFTGIRASATYYLHNPDMLSAFEAEMRALGLDDMFLVTTDEAGYNAVVQPVEGLRSVTFTFVIVVISLGAVILILLSTISIRERKYEIGVLRAMGMKKSKVALGLLSEVVMITLVCLVVGLGAGIVVAQPVSDMLLDNQLQQIEPQTQDNPTVQFGNFGRGGMGGAVRGIGGMVGGAFGGILDTPAEALQSMDVSISAVSIGQIILVSLILAIVSSIVGIAHVTKYEPIKILSERT